MGTGRRPVLAPGLRATERRSAILWAGEKRGWWEWLAVHEGHYLVLINDEAHLLSPDEVDRIPLDSVYSGTGEGWETAGIHVPHGSNGF
jgi:hypothetical protein